MNTRDPQALIEKLKTLPPERVAEVADFVDFFVHATGSARRCAPPPARLNRRSPRSGTTTTMPPTTSYSFGDIVLVPFPFTDLSATKRRPAAVVSSAAYKTR